MTTLKLADLRYEDALALLVLRKQALDSGAIARLSKQAMDQTHWLTNTGLSYEKKALDSNLQNALIGAGVGGGIGGLGNLAFGNKSKRKINRFLEGGLAGAGLGGGLGMLYNPAMAAMTTAKENKKKEIPLSSTLDPATDKNLQSSQAYALDHPEDTAYSDQVRDLTNEAKNVEQQGMFDVGLAGAGGGLAGGIGYRTVAGLGQNLERNKKPAEIISELTHKLNNGLINDKGTVNVNKMNALKQVMNEAQNARAKVDRNFFGLREADIAQELDDIVKTDPNPNARIASRLEETISPKTLKDKDLRKLISTHMTEKPEDTYKFTKPRVAPPTANRTVRSLLFSLPAALAELATQKQRRADLSLKAVEQAAARPGYDPVVVPGGSGLYRPTRTDRGRLMSWLGGL